jgi:hypothetical protein
MKESFTLIVQALFKDMTKEDKEEFMKGAEEVGFQKGELP